MNFFNLFLDNNTMQLIAMIMRYITKVNNIILTIFSGTFFTKFLASSFQTFPRLVTRLP